LRVTPPLGTRGPAYGGEYYTPTLRLALWHARGDRMNTNVTEVWNEFVAALETAYTGEFVAALETATCQEPKGSLYNRGLQRY